MSPHAETEEPMLGNGVFRVAANAFALADLTWIVLLVLRRRKGSRSGLTICPSLSSNANELIQ